MQEKKALTGEVSKRYQRAGKKEKTAILNEFVKITGGNRKYLLHKLANWGKTATVRLGGKILAPFMRFLEVPFRITQGEKELLLSASPSTIDRILRADKKKLALKGKSGTKPGKLLKKQIPVRIPCVVPYFLLLFTLVYFFHFL
jgi:hypothetical protein